MTGRHALARLPASALGDPEQVRRADRFKAANPDVIILARFCPARACIDGEWYYRGSLRSLMDALEELRTPGEYFASPSPDSG